MNIRKIFVTVFITLLSIALSPMADAQTAVRKRTTRTRTTHHNGPADVKVTVTKTPRKRTVARRTTRPAHRTVTKQHSEHTSSTSTTVEQH